MQICGFSLVPHLIALPPFDFSRHLASLPVAAFRVHVSGPVANVKLPYTAYTAYMSSAFVSALFPTETGNDTIPGTLAPSVRIRFEHKGDGRHAKVAEKNFGQSGTQALQIRAKILPSLQSFCFSWYWFSYYLAPRKASSGAGDMIGILVA